MFEDIHALILTKDEESHIGRCIKSLNGQCSTITVIDSGSKDRTVEIVRSLGGEVHFNPWINYANQMKYGIDLLRRRGGWLLRIDADEIFDPRSKESLSAAVTAATSETDGLLIKRRIYFMGHRIRHGTIEPSWQLRLWRNGAGMIEQRWMDEHITVDGELARTGVILSDINLNSITWWTSKHNNYASREAIDVLNKVYKFFPSEFDEVRNASFQARLRRLLKEKIYNYCPRGIRALIYFLYRYIIRLGFLDGKIGLYYHFLQGLWYRTLVDAKIGEIERHMSETGENVIVAIRKRTGIDPLAPTDLVGRKYSGN